MRRRIASVVITAVALLLVAGPVSAAYPPGTFPGAAPGGAFRTVVMSRLICAKGGALQASYDQSALILQVPAGAFRECTQISIYAAETAVIAPLLPSGTLLVDSFAVGWDRPAPAAKPLALTINDAAITADAAVFETTTTGVAQLDAVKVQDGAVTMSFVSAPGYVVTVTDAGSLSPAPSAVRASESPAAIVPPPATSGDAALGLLALVALVVGGIALAVIAWVRSRRTPAA